MCVMDILEWYAKQTKEYRLKKLQEFIRKLAEDSERNSDVMETTLLTAAKAKHRFRMNVEKVRDVKGRTQKKIIMTFKDLRE